MLDRVLRLAVGRNGRNQLELIDYSQYCTVLRIMNDTKTWLDFCGRRTIIIENALNNSHQYRLEISMPDNKNLQELSSEEKLSLFYTTSIHCYKSSLIFFEFSIRLINNRIFRI